jgi:hypothetical protein
MHSMPDVAPLLTVADFEPHVGKVFLVDAHPKPLEIRLEKILRRPDDAAMTRQPFVLVFSSPWSALLLEAFYRMQPDGGHPVEMFLIPTQSAPGERRYYHAVFN